MLALDGQLTARAPARYGSGSSTCAVPSVGAAGERRTRRRTRDLGSPRASSAARALRRRAPSSADGVADASAHDLGGRASARRPARVRRRTERPVMNAAEWGEHACPSKPADDMIADTRPRGAGRRGSGGRQLVQVRGGVRRSSPGAPGRTSPSSTLAAPGVRVAASGLEPDVVSRPTTARRASPATLAGAAPGPARRCGDARQARPTASSAPGRRRAAGTEEVADPGQLVAESLQAKRDK